MEVVYWLFEVLCWLVVLWTPSLIAEYRHVRYRRTIDVCVLVSILVGWWLWFGVLVFALVGPTRELTASKP